MRDDEDTTPDEPLPEALRLFCGALSERLRESVKESETDPQGYARCVVKWARSQGPAHVEALRAELDAPDDDTKTNEQET